jgi:hypothetical protein
MESVNQTLTEILGRLNTITADVEGIGGEVKAMRQHMDDFGEDLDGVKRRLVDFDKSARPRVKVPPAAHAAATAVLTNQGPPLIEKPPQGGQIFHTAPSSPNQEFEQVKVRPPKHDFPKFSGEAPMMWLDRCLTYFDMYKVAENQ